MKVPRGKAALATAGFGAAAVTAALALGGDDGDPAAAQESGVPAVPLERRDLASRESVDGALGYADEEQAINRLAGTFTWLPGEGDVISRGRRLFEVDGEPVLLMYGNVPAYRDLAEGVGDGPDVRQLESNLAALGFDPGVVDDEFTSMTTAAVSDWQDSLEFGQTGEVELGRVVFLPGARRVTSLEVALGSDAAGGAPADASSGDPTASTDSDDGNTMLASYASDGGAEKRPAGKQDTKKGPAGKQPAGKKPAGAEKPPRGGSEPAQQGTAQLPSEMGADATAESGAGAEDAAGASSPSTPVMTTSSQQRVVIVELDPGDVSLAKRGRPVLVSLPDGKEVKGRIAVVATVAETSSAEGTEEGSSEETTIEVTISLREGAKVTALDQAPVTVELTDEVRREVFAVPVEALLGTAGGEYAIVVHHAEGRRQLPVTPGLFADGYVEIEGEGLEEGVEVEVPGE